MHTLLEHDDIMDAIGRNKFYLAMDYSCNNRCLFCVVNSKEKTDISLSTDELMFFLEGLKKSGELNGVKFVELSGGEPTLRKDLFYIMDWIRSNYPKIRFGMLSNARMFCNPYILSELSGFNMDWVYVPIHGDCAKLHDLQTGVSGSFNETILGIHNLFEYGINTSLKTVVTSLNYKKLPAIIKFVANEFPECRIFTICGLDVYGAAAKNKENVVVTLSDIIPYIQKGIEISKKYGLYVNMFSIPPCLLEKKYRHHVWLQRKDLLILKTPDQELKKVEYQYGTLKSCLGCILESKCSGSWFSYFEEMGAYELKPIEEG